MIHEVENRLEISELNTFEIQKGMGVRVPAEDGSEEGRAGGEDDFMSLNLLIITCQGHIEEVFVLPQLTKSHTDIVLKVIPAQAELFTAHAETWCSPFTAAALLVTLCLCNCWNI